MEKKELGHRLRRVRRRKPLLLQALIRSTQVAVSVFFAVEQRKNNIFAAKLKTISDALSIRLSAFSSHDSR